SGCQDDRTQRNFHKTDQAHRRVPCLILPSPVFSNSTKRASICKLVHAARNCRKGVHEGEGTCRSSSRARFAAATPTTWRSSGRFIARCATPMYHSQLICRTRWIIHLGGC